MLQASSGLTESIVSRAVVRRCGIESICRVGKSADKQEEVREGWAMSAALQP